VKEEEEEEEENCDCQQNLQGPSCVDAASADICWEEIKRKGAFQER